MKKSYLFRFVLLVSCIWAWSASAGELDRLLMNEQSPAMSPFVNYSGAPSCYLGNCCFSGCDEDESDCPACDHFGNCERQCDYASDDVDHDECRQCQENLGHCRQNNNCPNDL